MTPNHLVWFLVFLVVVALVACGFGVLIGEWLFVLVMSFIALIAFANALLGWYVVDAIEHIHDREDWNMDVMRKMPGHSEAIVEVHRERLIEMLSRWDKGN